MNIPQTLLAAGFARLQNTDLPTWQKEGVTISLSNGSLGLERGKVIIYDTNDDIILARLAVAAEERRQGKAREALTVVLLAAAQRGINVYIEPVPDVEAEPGLTKDALAAFYVGVGFSPLDADCRAMVFRGRN